MNTQHVDASMHKTNAQECVVAHRRAMPERTVQWAPRRQDRASDQEDLTGVTINSQRSRVMTTTTFSGISRELGATTRRRVFRLLGSAVALGAVAAVGRGESVVGKGKGKKKKSCGSRCNSEEKCVKGKCVPIRRGAPQGT
jgi:hypothetical protein